MAVSIAHCNIMKDVGRYADEKWHAKGPYIAGKKGYAGMHYVSVTAEGPLRFN